MKKVKFLLISASLMAFMALPAFSQKKEDSEKHKDKEHKEQIVITRKTDDKEKIVIEINGDKVTVNGKSVDELKDSDISVRRNKIRSGDYSFFYRTPGTDSFNFEWDDDSGPRVFRNMNQNMALLGVTTEKTDGGVLINDISKESAAEKSGLKKGDIITKIDDEKIEDPDDLSKEIRKHKPGDKVTVTFLRDKKEQKITAELGKFNANFNFNLSPSIPDMKLFDREIPRIQSIPRIAPYGQYWNMGGGSPKLGLSVQDTEDGKGVKVVEVDEESNAAKAGVKEDDVITHLNDKEVNNVDEVSKLVKESKDKASVMLKIRRDGKTQNIEVKMPKKLKTTNL